LPELEQNEEELGFFSFFFSFKILKQICCLREFSSQDSFFFFLNEGAYIIKFFRRRRKTTKPALNRWFSLCALARVQILGVFFFAHVLSEGIEE
jgi:hypothetical protein